MLRLSALLVLFAGCATQTGAPASGASASNITGSSTVSNDTVALVKPMYFAGTSWRIGTTLVCSGVVVGHQTVLTATHCLVGLDPTQLLLNTCDTSDTSCETPIVGYNIIQDATAEDHALVYTSPSVDLPHDFNRAIHPMLDTLPDLKGKAVTVAGFGHGGLFGGTSVGSTNGAKGFQAQVAVADVVKAHAYIGGVSDPNEVAFVTQSAGSVQVVRGDSGGPMLVGDAVVATHSAALAGNQTWESPVLAATFASKIDVVTVVGDTGVYGNVETGVYNYGQWTGPGTPLSAQSIANCVSPCPDGMACGDDGQGGQQCAPVAGSTPDAGNTTPDGGTAPTACVLANNGSDCPPSQVCVPNSDGVTGTCQP